MIDSAVGLVDERIHLVNISIDALLKREETQPSP